MSAYMAARDDTDVLFKEALAEPPRRLVIRWQYHNKPEIKAGGESQCTMELEPYPTGNPYGHRRHPIVSAHCFEWYASSGVD
jgi:hypothetical protein